MSKRFCTSCNQNVKGAKRKFSWFAFIICLGIFYLPYHWFIKRKIFCPMCGLKTKRKRKENDQKDKTRLEGTQQKR
jgi:rRNA maturation endonuclease Nob1